MTFNKQQSEYDLETLKLTHGFALKMAAMICWAVVCAVIILGVCMISASETGIMTPLITTIITLVAIILGIITFSCTRRMCIA
jgi:hypothetical protein